MKLAALVLCHRNPFMVNALLEVLHHKDVDVYVHVDARSGIDRDLVRYDNVVVLGGAERIHVRWGDISQIHATLRLLSRACASKVPYDYVWLMSGQDYPLMKMDEILHRLTSMDGDRIDIAESLSSAGVRTAFDKRNEIWFPRFVIGRRLWQRFVKGFIVAITGGWERTFRPFLRSGHRRWAPFYFGGQWWCLRGEVVRWMCDYLDRNRDYLRFYSRSLCPDESFFQTLYMRSPFAAERCEGPVYVSWADESSPKILHAANLPVALASGRLTSRKWDFADEQDTDYQVMRQLIAI